MRKKRETESQREVRRVARDTLVLVVVVVPFGVELVVVFVVVAVVVLVLVEVLSGCVAAASPPANAVTVKARLVMSMGLMGCWVAECGHGLCPEGRS